MSKNTNLIDTFRRIRMHVEDHLTEECEVDFLESYLAEVISEIDYGLKLLNAPAEEEEKDRLYFAYGANLNIDAMVQRCPHAIPVGAAKLRDYQLVFRGVADIRPKKKHVVSGALWVITRQCERSLDWFEGYPTLYIKKQVSIETADGPVSAMVYIMNSNNGRTRQLEQPSSTYFRGIAKGYEDFQLPLKKLAQAAQAAPRNRNMESRTRS